MNEEYQYLNMIDTSRIYYDYSIALF